MRGARSQRSWAFRLLSLALLAFLVFAPVVTYGFAYDDHWTVEHNPALAGALAPLLRHLLAGQGAVRGIPDATRPGMVVSLWVDRHLFGEDPSGYHLDSLLLYCGSVVLAALAVLSITRRPAAALVGGAFFAVCPVHAEVVAAVNYREDLLAAVAVFGVLAWLLGPRRSPATVDASVPIAALLAAGLLAKESTVAVVPMLFAALLARLDVRGFWAPRRTALACTTVTLLLWGVWRAWIRISGRDDVPVALVHRGFVERALRTARYVVRVTLDGLFSYSWSPDYAPDPAASPLWLLALAGLVALVVLLRRWPRGRVLASGIALAALAGLPTSPLVSPINERADRFAFLATLGGAVFWGSLGARVATRFAAKLRPWALGLALLPLVIVARSATAPWKSDDALWAAAIRRAPDSPRAWTGYALTLKDAGKLDAADQAVERAIALDPNFLRARVTRVFTLLARGDVVRARSELEDIRRRGGARQLGMRKAATCASLSPEDAVRCAND